MVRDILSGFLDLVIQAVSTPDHLSDLRSDLREMELGLDISVWDELVHTCDDRVPEALPQ